MSNGAKVQLAWTKKVAPGVTPPGDWHTLTRISNGVTLTYDSKANNEIGTDCMAQGTATTTVGVGGDIENKWRYRVLDEFMTSCFGESWVANTLAMGNNHISFSPAAYVAGIGVADIARGAQVVTMAFNFPGDSKITVTTTFATTDWSDKADDTSPIVNAQLEPAQHHYSFKNISGLKLSDQQVEKDNACADSFNLRFDNAAQTQRCIGNSDPFPGNIVPATFTPSGSITTGWLRMTYQLWKAQQTGDATSLEFTVNNADGDYRISLPEMEVSGSWLDASAGEIVQVELNYTARHIPPVIARLPTPIVIASVTVTPDIASVTADETVDLEVEVLPADASQTVTWPTSDTVTAIVNDTGLVTGVTIDTATVTAASTAGPIKIDTCAITVTA